MLAESNHSIDDPPADPPEGFQRLPTSDGYNTLFGPLYGRLHDGRLKLGFRILQRHINTHGTCHGGALASFADFQAYAVQHEAKVRHVVTPTVAITIDYLAPALLGEWLEAETQLLRATRSLLFSQSVARVGERAIFRSSGIFKLGAQPANPSTRLGNFFIEPETI